MFYKTLFNKNKQIGYDNSGSEVLDVSTNFLSFFEYKITTYIPSPPLKEMSEEM